MNHYKALRRGLLAAGVAAGALAGAAHAFAADAAAPTGSAPSAAPATTEGVEVSEVIVTLEKDAAAAAAPTKAPLDETQPESVITRKFIEQATSETGGWSSVALIAPSLAGISSNAGGIGDYNVYSMRGFKDGQFNLTFGIAFGDTNDPTHHGADYWPASTIGAVVVDRGPGAAGDLGAANFGGALKFFSPEVSAKQSVVQKLTYGSFDTMAAVTTINTGEQSWLGGGKLLLNFDERKSEGELTQSGGNQFNQMAKYVVQPVANLTITALYQHEWTRFNFEDSSGPGETWQQVQLFGKNFSMNSDPNSEHYFGYNYEKKQTDFGYIHAVYQIQPTLTLDNDLYEYFYANKTISSNDLTGATGPDLNGFGATANTSAPNVTKAPQSTSDIGGYNKLNDYHVYGDILRLNKDWSFGTLKVGGLVEGSQTQRHNCFIDETLGGAPDMKFSSVGAGGKYPLLSSPTNCKLQENSDWFQGQLFADFYWRPIANLTITPGFKFVDFTRNVNAAVEKTGTTGTSTDYQPLNASNTYTKPLYFLTANYKILPYWSVYGQYATSFLIPSLSALYVTGAQLQSLKPETTVSYQAGTVFTHGRLTADADVYEIDASNLYNSCNIADPVPGNPNATEAGFCNFGKSRYSGVEGDASYALPFGLTVFANGSLNTAKQLANAPNAAAGIQGNTAKQLQNAPKWTAAAGLLYSHGPWAGSLTYKDVGSWVDYGAATIRLPGYDTFNGSVSYKFSRYEVKFQAMNLFDRRAITSYTPTSSSTGLYQAADAAIYTFQSGRELSLTLIGKF